MKIQLIYQQTKTEADDRDTAFIKWDCNKDIYKYIKNSMEKDDILRKLDLP